MRVVLATNQFPKYSETFIVRQFLGLLELGWDVHVVCPSSDERQYGFFPEIADAEHRDRVHVDRDVDAAVNRLRPDIVHFEFGTVALGRMHLRERYGCRTVVSFRGYDINYYGLDDPNIYRDVWDKADMLHFVGNDVANRAFRRSCPPTRAWRVIPDAADAEFFTPADRTDIRGSDGPLRILSVGRLHWKKGYEFGIEAVARLRRAGTDVEFRIIGDGDMREAVSFAIHDLGLDDVTSLSGSASRTEVREALWWADVFLHAAVSEGFCVSALEAQACGVPVVCSDADGLGENVSDGETGLVVPRRDPTALAAALATIASDRSMRERMGAAARRRVVENFSISAQTKAFHSLYQELLGSAVPSGDGPSDSNAMKRDLDGRVTQLDAALDALAVRRARLTSLRSARAMIRSLVPSGSSVLVVSRGDDRLLLRSSHSCRHFPHDEAGRYSGFHPRDSRDAIDSLEHSRSGGAEYIVFPATSLWWLDHYVEFGELLAETAVELHRDAATGAVFHLQPRTRRRTAASLGSRSAP